MNWVTPSETKWAAADGSGVTWVDGVSSQFGTTDADWLAFLAGNNLATGEVPFVDRPNSRFGQWRMKYRPIDVAPALGALRDMVPYEALPYRDSSTYDEIVYETSRGALLDPLQVAYDEFDFDLPPDYPTFGTDFTLFQFLESEGLPAELVGSLQWLTAERLFWFQNHVVGHDIDDGQRPRIAQHEWVHVVAVPVQCMMAPGATGSIPPTGALYPWDSMRMQVFLEYLGPRYHYVRHEPPNLAAATGLSAPGFYGKKA